MFSTQLFEPAPGGVRRVVSASGTATIDCTAGDVFLIDGLQENTTLAILNPSDGKRIELHVIQDVTGTRTVTLPSGVTGTWSDTGNTSGLHSSISFRYDLTNTEWYQATAQTTYA